MKTKKESPLSFIGQFAKPYKSGFAVAILLAILGVMGGMIPYFAVAKIITGLVAGIAIKDFYMKWVLIAFMGYIIKVLGANLSTGKSHEMTFTVLKDIRKRLMQKLEKVPMGLLLDTPSGRLKNIIVDLVERLETTFAHLIPEMTANILGPLFLLMYLFYLDWRMALISLITLPVGMAFMGVVMKTYPIQYEKSVKIGKEMNDAIVEYIGGIEVIKAFSQSASSYDKYSSSVTNNASFYYNWMTICMWPISAMRIICPAVLVTVLPIGFLFYSSGSLTGLEFISIIIVSMSIIDPIINAMDYVDSLAIGETTINMVKEILSWEELKRPAKSKEIKSNHIEFKNVGFSYHEKDLLVVNNISLTIPQNSFTAFVGPSGSGKSTLAKLLAGFWDVTEGKITIGGIDLKDISQKDLANKIAYVSQDNFLFDDTIMNNIRTGNPYATDQEVYQAAKSAGCDFIDQLPNKYNTIVGGKGGHLSGGERQRIAIARAILKNAPIIILDEATAYIDPENEAIIQRSINQLVKGKTLIVIAHRLSTITSANQIALINNGNLEMTGTHEELLQKSELYKSMWTAHIGGKDGDIND
ncbi:ABC transporter ATP-binding protein [Inediibacterium massiliense]|uniref:ABC transporter ATP-binding protein n=1 Tax=Inediibacterium massiliense TaxID=1658111 RepID=UPI0006B5129A|nr:ABC transporter ATP-binding protein [Inediibacterium massiliense]